MLHVQHHHHLPQLKHSARKIQLDRVASEDDELIQAIEQEHTEDNWQLDANPDVTGLDTFWTGVQEDLKNDPTWFSFTEE